MTTADSNHVSAPSPGQPHGTALCQPVDRPSVRCRLPRSSRALTLTASLCAAVVGTALAAPTEAQAAIPRVLREGTRPMAFLLGLGPSWGVGGSRWYYGDYNNGRGYGWGRYGGNFKLTQEFMGHFSGNASGPALGVILNETFNGPYFGFAIAPKFTYDIRVKQGLGLYVSPSVSLGYSLTHYRPYFYEGYFAGSNYHAANLQFGVAVKLMLDDRWLVFAQVPNFDFLIGPGGYYLNVYYGGGGCPPGYGCGAFFRAKLVVMFGGGVAF